MNICHFCKCDIDDNKEFKIVNPEGQEIVLCGVCVEDITSIFKMGILEDCKLHNLSKRDSPRLLVEEDPPARKSFFYEKTLFGTRIFNNIEIQSIEKATRYDYGYDYLDIRNQGRIPSPRQIQEFDIRAKMKY